MISLLLQYASGQPRLIELAVPDMGLTPREWANAAAHVSHLRANASSAVPGAEEISTVLWDWPSLGEAIRPLRPGDTVTVLDMVVELVDDFGGGVKVGASKPLPAPLGPSLHVSVDTPPPMSLAYAEDARDRLWTGCGAGTWRCLTDAAGRTQPGQWATVWREYGPLTPLVAVQRLDEPVSHDARRSMSGMTAVGDSSWA